METTICANWLLLEKCSHDCSGYKHWPLQSVMYGSVCTDIVTNPIVCESHWTTFKWDEDNLIPSCTFPSILTGSTACVPCICATECGHPPLLPQALRSGPQTSDVTKNKIITSVGFRTNGQSIIFEIQDTIVPAPGTMHLDPLPKKYSNVEEPSVSIDHAPSRPDYYLSLNDRNLYLDEIFVPSDYVVTGLAFHKTSAADGSSAVQIIIQGTKYNPSTYQLIGGSSKWFDSDHQAEPRDVAYNSRRSKIPLENCSLPEDATHVEEYPGTNHYVRFRATDETKSKVAIIPYVSRKKADAGGVPLRSIGLAYAHQDGFGGYVFVEGFRHEAWNILAETEAQDENYDGVPFLNKLRQSSSSICHCQYIVNVILILLIVLE